MSKWYAPLYYDGGGFIVMIRIMTVRFTSLQYQTRKWRVLEICDKWNRLHPNTKVVRLIVPMGSYRMPMQANQSSLHPTCKGRDFNKILTANIIYLIEWTTWVSSIVVVPKKNGKIRVCIDYRQVNEDRIRDKYPLAYIEHLNE